MVYSATVTLVVNLIFWCNFLLGRLTILQHICEITIILHSYLLENFDFKIKSDEGMPNMNFSLLLWLLVVVVVIILVLLLIKIKVQKTKQAWTTILIITYSTFNKHYWKTLIIFFKFLVLSSVPKDVHIGKKVSPQQTSKPFHHLSVSEI